MAVAEIVVSEAREWARFLVTRESRGFGDHDNAIRRLCNRYEGLTPSMISNLLYRPPSDMLVSKYLSLRQAFIAECERQENALRHDREMAEAKSLFGKAFVSAGSALARAADVLDSEEG
ncbi:hypothetical protein [Methylocystis sp. S23]